jgi:glycosyltransferase involved in cell wall biosynthesis
MVAPPYFTVPPDAYGGVENVVAQLVDGLVEHGHEVTLLGAGQHGTRAQRFIRTWDELPTDQLGDALPEVVHAAKISAAIGTGSDFDLVHDHTLAGPLLAPGRLAPTVVTVHGPMDDLADLYRPLGRSVALVAISDAQRRTAPDLNWVGTVHNGIDVADFPFRRDKDDYVLFLGRYHPTKAPHLAIDAARAAGVRILLAGKCAEPAEREYFDAEVAPRLGPDAVEVGEADGDEKRRLLAGARSLVFPICWEEPFGMVLVEALACGTPVVALARGSVPEVVEDGRTGIVVDRPEDLAGAIERATRLDPGDCRRSAETLFSTEAMTSGYEEVFRRLVASDGPSAARQRSTTTTS